MEAGRADAGGGRLAAALLAAGSGRRFGGDKRFVPLFGRPLLAFPLRALIRASARFPVGVFAVVDSPSAARVEAIARDELREAGSAGAPLRVVASPDPAEGIAASIRRAAWEAERASAAGLLVLLADMPLVGEPELAALADAWRPGRIVLAEGPGGPQPPAIFPQPDFASLAALRGDRGARDVWARAPGRTDRIRLPGEWWRDVDTPEDLEAVRCLLAGPAP